MCEREAVRRPVNEGSFQNVSSTQLLRAPAVALSFSGDDERKQWFPAAKCDEEEREIEENGAVRAHSGGVLRARSENRKGSRSPSQHSGGDGSHDGGGASSRRGREGRASI